jgi:proline iminopeptidase
MPYLIFKAEEQHCLRTIIVTVILSITFHSQAANGSPVATLSAPDVPRLSDSTSVFDQLQDNVWYLPTTDKRAQLYVTSFGKGPTIVVLHGGPGNDFNYLVDALRPLAYHYRFILFDQRGSLLSPVPSDQLNKLTMSDLVGDIETLRKALGLNKLVILGHSFGTLLAEFYFQAHPGHVAALILAGSMPPSTAPGNFIQLIKAIHQRQNALHARPAVAYTLRTAGIPVGQKEKLTPHAAMRRFKIDNAAIDFYHVDRWPEFQGGGVYYNEKVDDAIGNSLPNTYDVVPVLQAHPVPVSILQGDHDYVDPSATLWREDAGNMNNVKIYVIKDAGHYSWIDAPFVFKADLTLALQRSFSG